VFNRNTPWGRVVVQEVDALRSTMLSYGRAIRDSVLDVVHTEQEYRHASGRSDEIVERLIALQQHQEAPECAHLLSY